MIPLECPVQIGPREVILMDDLVLTHLSGPLAERVMPIASEDADLPLYVEQEQADALSELHPGLPLYGLWQVLVASRLVPPEPGLYQVATDSSPHEGRYLLRDSDGAYSGQITNETRLDVFAPGEAAPRSILIDPAHEHLHLPPQPIQTLRHRQAHKARARIQTLTLAGLMALISVFAGTAADRILSHRHAQKVQQAERLREQTVQLQQDLTRLESSGRIEPIDQSHRLDQLLLLSRHFQPVEFPQTSVLTAPTLSAIIHPLGFLPPTVPAGLPARRITHQPDGSLRIVW